MQRPRDFWPRAPDDPSVAAPGAEAMDADAYAELKRRVVQRGLLQRHPRRYVAPAAALSTMLVVIGAGIVLSRGSVWVFAWTVPAALLFAQVGFIAHEAAHNQVMRTSRGNYMLSLLLFNLGLGGSRGWWAKKHNLHHAHPNRIGVDPDITGGVIATSASEALQARGFSRMVMRRQATVIWPLLSLGVVQIHVDSAGFVYRRQLRHARCEAILLVAHAVTYFAGLIALLGLGRGLLFALVHQLLLGAYLGAAFLPNHLGMPMLLPDQQMDYLSRQVVTARNLRSGRVTNYVFGALGCQIEHHLFPTMPRYHLREASPMVRQFCADRGIPYHETRMGEAFGEVHRHLRTAVASLLPTVA